MKIFAPTVYLSCFLTATAGWAAPQLTFKEIGANLEVSSCDGSYVNGTNVIIKMNDLSPQNLGVVKGGCFSISLPVQSQPKAINIIAKVGNTTMSATFQRTWVAQKPVTVPAQPTPPKPATPPPVAPYNPGPKTTYTPAPVPPPVRPPVPAPVQPPKKVESIAMIQNIAAASGSRFADVYVQLFAIGVQTEMLVEQTINSMNFGVTDQSAYQSGLNDGQSRGRNEGDLAGQDSAVSYAKEMANTEVSRRFVTAVKNQSQTPDLSIQVPNVEVPNFSGRFGHAPASIQSRIKDAQNSILTNARSQTQNILEQRFGSSWNFPDTVQKLMRAKSSQDLIPTGVACGGFINQKDPYAISSWNQVTGGEVFNLWLQQKIDNDAAGARYYRQISDTAEYENASNNKDTFAQSFKETFTCRVALLLQQQSQASYQVQQTLNTAYQNAVRQYSYELGAQKSMDQTFSAAAAASFKTHFEKAYVSAFEASVRSMKDTTNIVDGVIAISTERGNGTLVAAGDDISIILSGMKNIGGKALESELVVTVNGQPASFFDTEVRLEALSSQVKDIKVDGAANVGYAIDAGESASVAAYVKDTSVHASTSYVVNWSLTVQKMLTVQNSEVTSLLGNYVAAQIFKEYQKLAGFGSGYGDGTSNLEKMAEIVKSASPDQRKLFKSAFKSVLSEKALGGEGKPGIFSTKRNEYNFVETTIDEMVNN